MNNIVEEFLSDEGIENLSVSQFRILEIIHRGLDMPADIARTPCVSPAATSLMLEKLGEKGFLQTSSSPTDRSRKLLELTLDGTGVVRKVGSRRKRYLRRILKDMDDETVERLDRSLDEFNQNYFREREKAGKM